MHHNYEDSDSGYEMDADGKSKGFGVGASCGRIIFLGDGTEVLTGSDDTEMFDNADEDKDLESQVSKSTTTDKDAKNEKEGKAESSAPELKSTESAESKPVSDGQEKQDTPASEQTKKD